MPRKKGKVKNNDTIRFEQLSFFELYGDDLTGGDTEPVEREEQLTLFDFESAKPIREHDQSTIRGSGTTLQTEFREYLDGIPNFRESGSFINDTRETEEISNGEGNDNGLDQSIESDESEVFERVHLNTSTLTTDQKIEYNIEAIRCLKTLQKEQRLATREEKTTLSRFSGWGGCPAVFNEHDDKYNFQRNEIKALLSGKEYQNAKASTLTSFYTPFSVIEGIYSILDRIGFKSGKIIETSMGTGNFIGLMNDDMYNDSTICGVEIDPISSAIADLLYDKVNVQNVGYENNPYPKNYFDLAISNIPFGNYQVHDTEFNQYHWNIHNYFFGKALSQVRNGGIVAFITSTDTMDGNSSIMRYINEKADFLGAIRLPNDTFTQNGANTQVVSDVILLRRNDDKMVDHTISYVNREMYTEHRYMNRYFIEHPEMVFGTVGERKTQYGNYELTVSGSSDELLQRFEQVLHFFPENVYEEEQEQEFEQSLYIPIDVEHSNCVMNAFFIENETLYYREENFYYPVKTLDQLKNQELPAEYVVFRSSKDIDKLIRMLEIVNTALRVIEYQVKNADETLYLLERDELNKQYDEFVKLYGALHKRTNLSLLEDDPNVFVLESLESYNPKTKEIKKADLFFERTINPRVEVKSVENIEDAIRLSLDTFGGLNLSYIGTLYSKEEDEVREELLSNGYAYIDPISADLVLAEEYLSGDIYEKIEQAEAYGYQNNSVALRGVLPEIISAEDIKAQLGSTWIPIEYVNEFAHVVFKDSDHWNKCEVNYDKVLGQYFVSRASSWAMTSEAKSTWGVGTSDNVPSTKRQPDYTGYDLLDDVLNSRIPTIRNYWDEWNGEKNVVRSEINVDRTNSARDLADQLEEFWEEWLYADYDRKQHLTKIYNRTFNNVRLREYDGTYLSFPDMNRTISLEPYQKNAIARIMDTNTNTLLWQQVGAGKTFEMVASGMEMKRLGIRKKILYVVPNHLVSQWQKEFLTLYPNAKILVASKKDMMKNNRKIFVNKIATGNYDAIIMAHSSFKFLSVGRKTEIRFLERTIEQIQSAIEELEYSRDRNSTRIVKQLERTKKSIEKNIKKLTDTKRDDNLIPFEELGIDYLFVDEAHEFKNLYIYTAMRNVAGIQTQHSQKASDMYMKCKVLQEQGGGVCFATGTPVTNTMAELYNMQRFLQEDVLEKMNITCFDAWAKAFGRVVNSFEISVDGSRFVNRSRFCKFFNVAELMTQFKRVAEIQTAGMLRRELENSVLGRSNAVPPKHVGGKPSVIAIEPSEELQEYISNIVERTEAIHGGSVDPSIDNMLKVTSDSKKASIDMRLIDPSFRDEEKGKLWTIAHKVKDIYEEYSEYKATQLIFCDSSTPHNTQNDGESFDNVYSDLKKKMVALEIPENEIAFIHDYNSEVAKLELFDKMNKGEMRVLIGSTPKLGAGTNVQKRLIAVHHVDVPWKASDIEQQNGRAFRQGNIFSEIYEFRYVTKGSFDAYSWQMVETKSSYMQQLLEGTGDKREIEEDNQNSFSYAEVKAIASGNPIIKEKFEVDNEVKRLEGLRKLWLRKKYKAQDDLVKLPKQIENDKKTKHILEVEKDYFYNEVRTMNLDTSFKFVDEKGKLYTSMKEAWEHISQFYIDVPLRNFTETFVGTFMKAQVYLDIGNAGEGYVIRIKTPERMKKVDACNPIGRVNFSRILKTISEFEESFERMCVTLDRLEGDLATAHQMVNSSFQYDDILREMRNRQKEINKILDQGNETVIEIEELEEEESIQL